MPPEFCIGTSAFAMPGTRRRAVLGQAIRHTLQSHCLSKLASSDSMEGPLLWALRHDRMDFQSIRDGIGSSVDRLPVKKSGAGPSVD